MNFGKTIGILLWMLSCFTLNAQAELLSGIISRPENSVSLLREADLLLENRLVFNRLMSRSTGIPGGSGIIYKVWSLDKGNPQFFITDLIGRDDNEPVYIGGLIFLPPSVYFSDYKDIKPNANFDVTSVDGEWRVNQINGKCIVRFCPVGNGRDGWFLVRSLSNSLIAVFKKNIKAELLMRDGQMKIDFTKVDVDSVLKSQVANILTLLFLDNLVSNNSEAELYYKMGSHPFYDDSGMVKPLR